MVYAYYRVSTQTQAEQNGISMQVDVVERYCRENGIEIAECFTDEGVSGTIADREGLSDLLATMEKGDKVIVQNTSRLWRNDTVSYLVKHALKKLEADVISVEQPTFTVYYTDPNDFLLNGIMELLDQWDRMSISTKLAKGRKARANKGNKPCGLVPYGYRWQGNDVVIDYNNNLIVKDMFEKYLELKSLSKLSDYCTSKGYKTTFGKDFSKQTLGNMLKNDFYIGVVTYADKKIVGNHPAIIENELFESVNKLIKR